MFGDHTKAQRAVETLRTMKQGPRELFSAFLHRFEKDQFDDHGCYLGVYSTKRTIT
jgi:hypothetical protein